MIKSGKILVAVCDIFLSIDIGGKQDVKSG